MLNLGNDFLKTRMASRVLSNLQTVLSLYNNEQVAIESNDAVKDQIAEFLEDTRQVLLSQNVDNEWKALLNQKGIVVSHTTIQSFLEVLIQYKEHLVFLQFQQEFLANRSKKHYVPYIPVNSHQLDLPEDERYECPICYEGEHDNDEWVALTCRDPPVHIFHKRCIDAWINRLQTYYNPTCPTCRGRLIERGVRRVREELVHNAEEVQVGNRHQQRQVRRRLTVAREFITTTALHATRSALDLVTSTYELVREREPGENPPPAATLPQLALLTVTSVILMGIFGEPDD